MSINILGVDYSINDTTRLDLSKKNLKEIPNGVFELINLTLLDLDYNELTEIPIEINKLVNLKYLYLSNNHICDEESIKIFNDLPVRTKQMNNQKQQSIKMLPIVLPMVII